MIFITGGARSGKSALAEKIACERGPVTYIATARGDDEEMKARIAEHRRRRPGSWKTIESPVDLPESVERSLAASEAVVLVDCLTVYLSNVLLSQGIASAEHMRRAADHETDRIVDICRRGNGRVIVVSNEVGMGVVPGNTLARTFRDVAGRANQKLAAAADEVYLCVSGIPLKVK